MQTAAFYARHLGALAGGVVLCWAAGWALLGGLGLRGAVRGSARWVGAALATATGLVALGQLCLLLAMAGFLRPSAVAIATAGLAVPGLLALLRVGGRGASGGGRRCRLLAVVGLAAVGVPWFLAALYPPLAYDETTYHLPFARAFAEAGALVAQPQLRVPWFPALGESLFAAATFVAGDIGLHLVSLLACLATAVLAAAWVAGVGEHGVPSPGGVSGPAWVAGALVVGSPLFVYLGTVAYLEPLLGLATTLALLALARGTTGGAGAPRGWLLVAGLAGGTAAAIKYTGLPVLAVTLAVAGADTWRCRRWGLLLGVALTAAVAAGPTYVRLLVATGNPLFPFFTDWFGDSSWSTVADVRPAGAAWLARLALPIAAVFDRQAVGAMPPLSPIWPAVLGLAFGLGWRRPELRPSLAVAFLGWALAPANVRYQVAVLPVLAVAATSLLAGGWRLGRRAWLLLAVALALPAPGYAVYRLLLLGPPPVGPASREAFLARELPFYATLAGWRQADARPAVLFGAVAGGERLHAYAGADYRGEVIGPWSRGLVVPLLGDPQELPRALRRLEVDAVLLARPLPAGAAGLVCAYQDAQGAVLRLRPAGEPARPCPDWRRRTVPASQ